MNKRVFNGKHGEGVQSTFTFTFTFSHLADAFVQSDVQGRDTFKQIKTQIENKRHTQYTRIIGPINNKLNRKQDKYCKRFHFQIYFFYSTLINLDFWNRI